MMALPSTMNEKAAAYSNHQHELQQKQQQQQREHLKSKSAKSNHAQWKQKLRTDCIARAQTARRKKIQQARRRGSDDPQHNIGVAASSTIASSMCYNSDVTSCRDVNKRGRENNNDSNDEYEQMVDHIPMDDYSDVHGLQKMSSGGVSDEAGWG